MQTSKPITRRRGACKRCRARKVRCDGKILCSQCQRLGYECQYLPLTQRKRALSSSSGAFLQSLDISMEDDPAQYSPEDISLHALEATFYGDTLTSDLCVNTQGDTMASIEINHETGIMDITPKNSYIFNDSAYSSLSPSFDMGTQGAISGLHAFGITMSTLMQAENGTTCSSLANETPGEPDFLDSRVKYGSTQQWPLDAQGNGSGVNESTHMDSISAGRIKQNDLIMDALLDDIQQHCEQCGGSESEDVSCAIKRLIVKDVTVYPWRNGAHTNENEDALQLHQGFSFDCITASLSDPRGVSSFLDRTTIESAMREIQEQSPGSLPKQALAYVILALGAHILGAGRKTLNGHTYSPLDFFNAALKLKSHILERGFTVLGFQTLVSMTYFAALARLDETSGLLSNCIYYAQTMRLSRRSAINKLCNTKAHRQQTERAFWFLYTIEKNFCMRAEIFPVLHKDFVDYSPPKIEGASANIDWLLIDCHYANICASILRHVSGQESLRNQNPDFPSNIEEQLHHWVESLPFDLQSMDGKMSDMAAMSAQERRTRLHIFFQCHKALLALHTRRKPQHSTSISEPSPSLMYSDNKRASSVMKILAVSCQLTESDVRLDPTIYRLTCIATCSLAVATLRNPGDRRDLSYLATAAGFFGRMALAGIEGPLEEITEIIRTAQQSIKEKQQRILVRT